MWTRDPETPVMELAQRRVGFVFTVLALAAPALSWLPPDTPSAILVLYGLLCSAVAVCLIGIGFRHRNQALTGIGALAYVVAVMLLRHSEGGSASGYSLLLLLPIFWSALLGGTRILALVLVAIPVALAGPIVVLGDPAYPVEEWRRVIIWSIVAPVLAVTTHQLVRSERAAYARASALARTDALTGSLNRHGLDEAAERERRRAARTGEPLAVAILDLDHFKDFNDTYGHDAGDDLLRDAAHAWQDALRAVDVFGRWGGEEFVAILPDTPLASAVTAADKVRQATPGSQTCSVGVTNWNPHETLNEAVARADISLYEAKASGRNRVVAVPSTRIIDLSQTEAAGADAAGSVSQPKV